MIHFRTIRGRPGYRSASLAALLLLCAGAIDADGTDPGLSEGEEALILDERLDVSIESTTKAKVRYSQKVKVLTPQGVNRYRTAGVFYRPGVRIDDIGGSVTPPTGKKLTIKKEDIADMSAFASWELYSDSRMRVIRFPGVVPGATVEHFYEMSVSDLVYLPDQFLLQETDPVQSKTLTVSTNGSVPLSIKAPPSSAGYTRNGPTHRWTVTNVPAFRYRFDAPPLMDVVPKVTFTPQLFTFGSRRVDARDWNGIARFYWDLAEGRMQPTVEVSAKARSLTEGVSDPEAIVRRLYEFAQDINYVAVELGIGGYQPHESREVLANRYGDCKDKATLMIAMLRSLDLQGYPVLIRTRSEGLIDTETPALAFNHAIVAIPVEGGYRFLDPTSERTPYPFLPWVDQGVPALVVLPGGEGDLVTTPMAPPDVNRRHTAIDARIDSRGGINGKFTLQAWGERRQSLEHAREERRNDEAFVNDLLSDLLPGARRKDHAIETPERPEDPFVVGVDFSLAGFLTSAGSVAVARPHITQFPGIQSVSVAENRDQPIFFEYLFSETTEARLDLPYGRTVKSIPEPVVLEGPGVHAEIEYAIDDGIALNTLIVKRSVSVNEREIDVPSLPALRAFLKDFTSARSQGITIVKAGP